MKESINTGIELFEKLKQFKGSNITLLGHDNIDCDSIISLTLMSKLLKFNGVNHKIVITDENIGDETSELLRDLSVEFSQVESHIGSVSQSDVVFLLDHHKTSHSSNIIGCIDHHPTIDDFKYDIYINQKSASTAKIIYEIMEEFNYPITLEIVRAVAYSIFIDTCSLKSTKCPEADKIWIKELIKKYNLNYDEFYNKGLCLTDLNKSLYKIINNGKKSYNYGKYNVVSSYIQVSNNYEEIDISNIIKHINFCTLNEDIDLWVFLVVDFYNNKTREFRITKNSINENILDGIVSRGSTIMPFIEANIDSLIK